MLGVHAGARGIGMYTPRVVGIHRTSACSETLDRGLMMNHVSQYAAVRHQFQGMLHMRISVLFCDGSTQGTRGKLIREDLRGKMTPSTSSSMMPRPWLLTKIHGASSPRDAVNDLDPRSASNEKSPVRLPVHNIDLERHECRTWRTAICSLASKACRNCRDSGRDAYLGEG